MDGKHWVCMIYTLNGDKDMDYNKIGVGISLDKQENTHIYLSIN